MDHKLDVVLGCSSEDVAVLQAVLPGITGLGLTPTIVAGLEHGAPALLECLQSRRGPVLVVVCVSDFLERDQTHGIVEAYAKSRLPMHRLLVVELDSTRPHSLISPIRRGADGLRRQLATCGESPSGMRDSGREETLQGRADTSDDDGGELSRPDRSFSSVIIDPSLRDDIGEIPEHVALPRGARRPTPRLRVLPREHEKVANTRPGSGPSADSGPANVSDSVVDRPGGSRRGWPIVAVAAGALFGLGAWPLLASSFEAPTPASVELRGAVPSSGRSTAEAPQLSAPSIAQLRATADVPPAVVIEPDPPASAPATALASRKHDNATQAQLVDRAVAAGQLRALDLLIATKPYPAISDWYIAANRCKARADDGVRGWRLPTRPEIRTLLHAHLVPGAVYWTSTLAPPQDPDADVASNWVLDARRGRMLSRRKNEQATTVCVQRRP